MDLSDKERLIVGTLLHEVPSPLPEMLAKVLWHAPESFLDERLGTIAVTIREMELANKPVAPVTVRSSLSDGGRLDKAGGALFFDTIDLSAVTIPIADFEAADVWQAFVVRRAASVGSDLTAALHAAPRQAESIIKNARQTLEDLNTKSAPARYIVRSIGEIQFPTERDDQELLRHRFLCRGAGLLLAAPAGIGKSTFNLQAMLCFGIGRECFGFVPTGPLKSLYIQAENDDGDLRELRDGIFDGLKFTANDRAVASSNVSFVTVDDMCGLAFVQNCVEPLLRETRRDLLWIDPLLAYLGGQLSQEVVSPWLRNGLNPVLRRHKVGCILTHHTNKPASGKEKPDWRAGDYAYIGSGTIELANWPRAVVAIVSTGSHDVFELRLGKRGSRAGWRNPDGSTCYARYIAHGQDGIYWRNADENERPGTAGRKVECTVEDIIELLSGGMTTAEWQRLCRTEAGISERSFYRLKRQAEQAKRITRSKIDQRWLATS